ncbi:hypothetical protein R5R35_008581 [Gryllus longicercus]|uniref:GPI mannosyltransferase 2 n=1 Tax=Gryllus longicercus TaxID=2509291 RepID=A0AAN9V3U9_9ORTH
MILSLKDKVWWFALYSRVFVLATSALFNLLIPDHDADAFVAPKSEIIQETFGDVAVRYLCGGLMRWDAQYFMHIAMYGYTYENCLAFFPLYPLVCRVVAQVLYIIAGGILSDFSLYLISSVCINMFCFVKSASILYNLSLRVLKNERLAYRACIFYCVNPASIFFSASYSESLYSCLTFYGLLKCGCGFKEKFSMNCGIVFGLSGVTRSNGILNIGFIGYKCLKTFFHETLPKCSREIRNFSVRILWMMPVILMISGVFILPYILSVILSLLPFVSFQIYSYQKYCIPHNHSLPNFLVTFAKTNDLIIPGGSIQEEGHWCAMALPLSYSYIQSHYWNVGFLRYYQWKQIPNFVLAFPVVWIILSETYSYIKKHKRYCLYLGLYDFPKSKKELSKDEGSYSKTVHLPEDVLPYVIHVLFLTVFSVLCVHVQVTTRLISSSSPILYWFCAKIVSEDDDMSGTIDSSKLSDDLTKICRREKFTRRNMVQNDIEEMENLQSYWKVFVLGGIPSTRKKIFIHLYFLLFMNVGTILFSNFLPWT